MHQTYTLCHQFCISLCGDANFSLSCCGAVAAKVPVPQGGCGPYWTQEGKSRSAKQTFMKTDPILARLSVPLWCWRSAEGSQTTRSAICSQLCVPGWEVKTHWDSMAVSVLKVDHPMLIILLRQWHGTNCIHGVLAAGKSCTGAVPAAQVVRYKNLNSESILEAFPLNRAFLTSEGHIRNSFFASWFLPLRRSCFPPPFI